ncbi:fibrous sheath-interacting protein 2-like [Physeter macrocephalus]|uniref:Fibrous sheath-interacting protein 2-like n=1 Tax=Physeter macrocephalus TaxID=9755 RepID=A0A455AQ74_PHYMC|nr:fibrous sheath-interacting protein 2-like [Physeter catodon]|eukprot:XP_028338234.1 fibrous sheath-interacting protein 2-like [Physeter catodon]
MAMDLYLSNCYNIAQAAAAKAAASSLTADREQCDSSSQKTPIPEVGAAHLLNLPLGVKLPTNLSEKLYQPSYDLNLTDPYCQLLETSYKSLHDPHLKIYYRRKDILRRLKKGGYVTSNNKKMIEKQVINKLYETKRACDNYDNTQFQDWLLQESIQTTPDQELLIKQRYLDMISRELNKLEHMAEKQNILHIKEEER